MIVVTGGAGFIGSNIVAALNEAGRTDIVVSDLLGKAGKWQNLRRHVFQDFIPPHDLITWLDGHPAIDTVIHMGANSSTTEEDGDDVIERNFRFSLRLLDWCTAHRVKLIYASSAATYGDGVDGFDDDLSSGYLRRLRPFNLYGWSKHLFDQVVADRLARGDKLPPQCVGIKFFNVFGPNEYHKGEMMSVVSKFFPQIRRGEEIALFKSYRPDYPDGGQRRDFVYINDVVPVVQWLLGQATGVALFNLGTGRARTFVDLMNAIFDAVSLPCRIRYVDMPESLRPKYQYFTQANLTRLRQAGYDAPFMALEDAVAHFVRTYLAAADPYR